VFSISCALFWRCAEDAEIKGLAGAVFEGDGED
jgi:hypothetical protein